MLSNTVTFNWPAQFDAQGGIAGYQVIVGSFPGGSHAFSGIVSGSTLTITNVYGVTLFAEVSAINNAGIQGAYSPVSAGVVLVDQAWIPVLNMQSDRVLSWSSVAGKTYQIWSTTNLAAPFSPFGGTITASGTSVQSTNPASDSARYYRVQIFP